MSRCPSCLRNWTAHRLTAGVWPVEYADPCIRCLWVRRGLVIPRSWQQVMIRAWVLRGLRWGRLGLWCMARRMVRIGEGWA